MIQRLHMAYGEVCDMNIVPDARAVQGGKVITPDVEVRTPPTRHLCNKRHQVVGYAPEVFAYQAACMRTEQVEVAQNADAPLRVRAAQVAQDIFNRGLGSAVRVDGCEPVRFRIRQGFRNAVNSRAGAKHQRPDTQLVHDSSRQRLPATLLS